MPITRPKAHQIDFDLTNITDPLVRINSGQTTANNKDIGLVLERGSDTNVALIWDESADEFALINTSEDGTTGGNVTISSYASIRAGTFYGDGSGLTGVTSYTDSDVATYLSSNGYDTATNIVASITDSAPTTLDTLNELAAALGDDPNFATTVTNSIADKLPLAGGTLTGALTGTDATFTGTVTAGTMTDGTVSFNAGNITGVDTLRIDQSGTGLRMTNVGAFDNDGSDNFRIFATNDLQLKANGDTGGGLSIDVTNNDVTIDNDLRVSAGQFYYGGTAVTSTAAELNILDGVTATTTELNYVDGVTSNIQTQLDSKTSNTGDAMTGNLTLGDNVKAIFGAGSDLQIYHDGTHSYVSDEGTGNLILRGSNELLLGTTAGQDILKGTTGGDVKIYYNNSQKLATTSTGIDVAGDAKATRLIGNQLMESSSGVGSDTFSVVGGTSSNSSTRHGAVFFSKHVDSNALLVGTHDATFNSFVVKGNGNVGIGTTGPGYKLEVNGTIYGSGNITTGGVFSGTATSAQYADLAEKYLADEEYEPGTVLIIGGDAEVTACTKYRDSRLAGVVSTNPAYLMNNDLQGQHVTELALMGRVPCKVTGLINKGDLLTTSSTKGVATVHNSSDYIPGTIIGKALESYSDIKPGIIEILVGKV